MTHHKDNSENYANIKDQIYIDNVSILTRKSPFKLMVQIMEGKITRFSAWQILRLIHEEVEMCKFPQYGILTVFSLSKDMDEFQRLYDQGVNMLIDEGVVDDETLQKDFEAQKKMFKKDLKAKKTVVKVKTPKNNKLN